MRAVVVGGGLAGLAAALKLRAAGWQVTVCENGPAMGGKMNRWEAAGYRFDTGPTLLTMPDILRRLFASLGERLEDHLKLRPLDPHAEYIYPDGFRIAVPALWEQWLDKVGQIGPQHIEGIRRLHELGERIFRLSEQTFFQGHPLHPLRLPPASAMRAFPIRHAWGNYASTVRHFVQEPRLARIYLRYPTYVGSSPYLCPATLLIIPYLEHAFGAWYVEGGMYRIIEALVELARRRGVQLLPEAEVAGIEQESGRVRGVRLAGGARLDAATVVFNGDSSALAPLLGSPTRVRPEERSLSGLVLLVGLKEPVPGLQHHTVAFSSNYEAEFEQLFKARRFPDDPTVYVNAPPDPALAPPGGQALLVMANAPGDPQASWDAPAVEEAKRRVFERLRRAGLPDLAGRAEVLDQWHPGRFARRYLAPGGAIYGQNWHGWRRAFLRPPNRVGRPRGLYCTGGSFHPGGGVPMVLLSAEMTAALVLEEARN